MLPVFSPDDPARDSYLAALSKQLVGTTMNPGGFQMEGFEDEDVVQTTLDDIRSGGLMRQNQQQQRGLPQGSFGGTTSLPPTSVGGSNFGDGFRSQGFFRGRQTPIQGSSPGGGIGTGPGIRSGPEGGFTGPGGRVGPGMGRVPMQGSSPPMGRPRVRSNFQPAADRRNASAPGSSGRPGMGMPQGRQQGRRHVGTPFTGAGRGPMHQQRQGQQRGSGPGMGRNRSSGAGFAQFRRAAPGDGGLGFGSSRNSSEIGRGNVGRSARLGQHAGRSGRSGNLGGIPAGPF